MNERERPFLDFVRSAASWFLVVLITIGFFLPVAFFALFLLCFDRSKKNIHSLISLWARTILAVCPLMRVRLEGEEQLRQNEAYVFVANHQSLADILAVLHLKHPFKFIAKKELFWIPIFGWALLLAGYIPLVRDDRKSGKKALEQARRYLEQRVSVLFFPEGTRSLDGEIHAFKVGAFKLASELNVPVVPLVIDGTRNLIPKGSPLIGHSVRVSVSVEPPHQPEGRDALSIERLADEVRNKMVERLSTMRNNNLPSSRTRGSSDRVAGFPPYGGMTAGVPLPL